MYSWHDIAEIVHSIEFRSYKAIGADKDEYIDASAFNEMIVIKKHAY